MRYLGLSVGDVMQQSVDGNGGVDIPGGVDGIYRSFQQGCVTSARSPGTIAILGKNLQLVLSSQQVG
jgi:hypothetical protein